MTRYPPLPAIPANRLRAYTRHVLTRTPTHAARARHGSRRRPIPRWIRR